MWSASIFCFLLAQQPLGLPERTASELLEAVRVARDSEPPSAMHLILHGEYRRDGKAQADSILDMERTICRDENRIDVHDSWTNWLRTGPRGEKDWTIKQYNHMFWDSGRYYTESVPGGLKAQEVRWSGGTTVTRNSGNDLHDFSSGGALRGYMIGDARPFYEIMAESPDVRVSVDATTIPGVPCYFLEADTDRGLYQVWVDPAAEYNLRRARVERDGADLGWNDIPVGKRDHPVSLQEFEVTDVKIGSYAGHVVVVEGRHELRNVYMGTGPGGIKSREETNLITIDKVDFDPDFQALGAFNLEAPDGTVFSDADVGLPFVLRDGELVPYVLSDETLKSELDNQLADIGDNGIALTKGHNVAPSSPEIPSVDRQSAREPTPNTSTGPPLIVLLAAACVLTIITIRRLRTGAPPGSHKDKE